MSQPDALPGWRARRRAAILEGAAELFAHTAYPEVQMDEVARRGGVGKATLYRYVVSKEELFLEVFEAALVELAAQLRAAAAAAPPETALVRMIETLVAALAGRLPSLRAMDENHADLVQRGRRVLRRRIKEIRAELRATLAEGVRQGVFRPVDLEVVPQLVVGMVRGGIMGTTDVPPDRLVAAILDLLLGGGLLARRGVAARPAPLVALAS